MLRTLRLILAQLDMVVGDIAGNTERIVATLEWARSLDADLVAFPELAITGYPPEDLLLKSDFVDENSRALEKIAASTSGIAAIVGHVARTPTGLTNSAAVCIDGRIVATYAKHLLPNYGVFDEERYFEAGSDLCVVEIGNVSVGISICEDAWSPSGPVARLGDAGAQLIVNINASPFHRGKSSERLEMLGERARQADSVIAYVNLVGGQDELVFDGESMVVSPDGELIGRARSFDEDTYLIDLRVDEEGNPVGGSGEISPQFGPVGEVYEALKLAIRDYTEKNGFEGVVVGLSGGVDSALTATLAVDALGAAQVVGLTMPSRYTSLETKSDAEELARRLIIRLEEIPIEGAYSAYLEALSPIFAGRPRDVTEENIQARIRGNYLMALSNKFGWLVLATGNKSEMATGYSTLYGDLAGGFAPLKDVPKTFVYKLCEYRNGGVGDIGPIPRSIIERPPSAELRPNQLDEDSLPPYAVLDQILELYVEQDKGAGEIVDAGFDRPTVERVIRLVDRAEYKRRQAPPGVKITKKAFGKDRRLPITNHYIQDPG